MTFCRYCGNYYHPLGIMHHRVACREKNSKEFKIIQGALEDFKEANWVGEDGNMACVSSTALGAFRKFKRLMREDCGEYEATEMKLEQVGIGYLRIADQEDREDIDVEVDDWLVYWGTDPKKFSKYKVWVYFGD